MYEYKNESFNIFQDSIEEFSEKQPSSKQDFLDFVNSTPGFLEIFQHPTDTIQIISSGDNEKIFPILIILKQASIFSNEIEVLNLFFTAFKISDEFITSIIECLIKIDIANTENEVLTIILNLLSNSNNVDKIVNDNTIKYLYYMALSESEITSELATKIIRKIGDYSSFYRALIYSTSILTEVLDRFNSSPSDSYFNNLSYLSTSLFHLLTRYGPVNGSLESEIPENQKPLSIEEAELIFDKIEENSQTHIFQKPLFTKFIKFGLTIFSDNDPYTKSNNELMKLLFNNSLPAVSIYLLFASTNNMIAYDHSLSTAFYHHVPLIGNISLLSSIDDEPCQYEIMRSIQNLLLLPVQPFTTSEYDVFLKAIEEFLRYSRSSLVIGNAIRALRNFIQTKIPTESEMKKKIIPLLLLNLKNGSHHEKFLITKTVFTIITSYPRIRPQYDILQDMIDIVRSSFSGEEITDFLNQLSTILEFDKNNDDDEISWHDLFEQADGVEFLYSLLDDDDEIIAEKSDIIIKKYYSTGMEEDFFYSEI